MRLHCLGGFLDGLDLYTEASREQIELLEIHQDGSVVAEYWTTLPPKAEPEAKIREIYRETQERIARRQITPAEDESSDEDQLHEHPTPTGTARKLDWDQSRCLLRKDCLTDVHRQ